MSLFYGPGDWLAHRTTSRDRRAVATWLAMLFIFPGTPISFFWRSEIWMLWLMSDVALILALLAVAAGETPVERE